MGNSHKNTLILCAAHKSSQFFARWRSVDFPKPLQESNFRKMALCATQSANADEFAKIQSLRARNRILPNSCEFGYNKETN
jgi:hypothetical protein